MIPDGELLTVPEPLPANATVKAIPDVKFAVIVVAPLTATVQVPVLEQLPPLQPEKVEPLVATAVKVTDVPAANDEVHVAPQLTPESELVTVPVPAPVFVTVRT